MVGLGDLPHPQSTDTYSSGGPVQQFVEALAAQPRCLGAKVVAKTPLSIVVFGVAGEWWWLQKASCA